MKNIIAIVLVLALVNCAPTVKPTQNLPVTSSKVIKEKLSEDPFLVDVRTPEEFAKGSAKGAVNIPLDEIQNRISEFEGKKNIVTFCVTGKRSGKAISILKENGITDAVSGIGLENVKKLQEKN
ncbi:rhodanese-like domain-containing protein [Halpernia sp. GG3]